jgi:hypothetical protein
MIRCFFDPWIRDQDSGSGMGKKSGSGIRDEHLRLFFRKLRNSFRVKILEFFDADPDIQNLLTLDPGSGMEKFGSRDKHPR